MKAPLVVLAPDGAVVDVVLSSEKSRAKSLEQSQLWIVDSSTGRVLPWRGGVACGATEDHGTWHLVTISGEVPAETLQERDGEPRRGAASAGQAVAASSPHVVSGAGASDAGAPGAGPSAAVDLGPVLADLTATIAERHRTMSEGSYTTHLFTKGGAKIRKKTGEEAVEVILASDHAELVSESADLLYHLMVLLESEGLSIGDVLSELGRRHAAG